MSPFFINRSLSISKEIDVQFSTVLKCFQDPIFMISTGPLLHIYTVDPTDPELYEITDSITFLGCLQTKTKFNAKLTPQDDGIISDVSAGMGTKVRSQWKVKSLDGGMRTRIDEETSVKVHLHHNSSLSFLLLSSHSVCFFCRHTSLTRYKNRMSNSWTSVPQNWRTGSLPPPVGAVIFRATGIPF